MSGRTGEPGRTLALASVAALLAAGPSAGAPFYHSHNSNHDKYYNLPPQAAQGAALAGAQGALAAQSALGQGGSEAARGGLLQGLRLNVPDVGLGRPAGKSEAMAPTGRSASIPRAETPGAASGGDAFDAGGPGAAAGGAGADSGGLRRQPVTLADDPSAAAWEAAQRRFSQLMRSGDQKLGMGDAAGALDSAEAAIRAEPSAPGGYLIKATALGLLSRYAEAERAALQSVERGADGEAWEQLAWAQLNQGKSRDAARNAGKAAELDPRSATAFAVRAFAEEHLGDRKAMLSDLRRAAELDPERYAQRLRLADSNVRLFDPQGADTWSLLEGVRDAPAPLAPAAPAPQRPAALAVAGASLALGCWFLWRRRWSAQAGSAALDGALAAAAGSAARPAPAAEGETLGEKYRVRRRLGRGGQGESWLAHDPALDRPVFIKRMEDAGAPGGEAYAACLRQARRLGELRHPNIADIFEILELPSGLHLVFEFVEGKTVQQLLGERGRLPLAQAVQLLRPACAALMSAHSRDIVHGNLKPSNLMLGVNRYVKLLDFGLGEAPVAEDVRALGALLYTMAAGAPPLDQARDYVPAASRIQGLDPRLDEVVRKALDPDPGRRYRAVQWFAEAMEQLAS